MSDLPLLDDVLKRINALEHPAEGFGRVLAHCAQSIECSVHGFPKCKPAWFQKTIGRLVLKKFRRQGRLKHDRAAPVPGAPEVPEQSLAQGRERLGAAIATFSAHVGPLAPHFAFGPLDRETYAWVHAMHIADHLRD